MEDDLSNRTITILVILTITITILGALSVLTAVNDLAEKKQVKRTETGDKAQVALEVTDGSKGASSVTGRVGLNVKEPEGDSNEEENVDTGGIEPPEQEYDAPLPE